MKLRAKTALEKAQDRAAELSADLERVKSSRQTEFEARVAAERLRNEAFKERDETRAQFAELKQRLVDLTAENARMHGYIDRVRELDIAADEPVLAAETTTYEHQPRHRPRFSPSLDNRPVTANGEGRSRKHWTNFGG